MKAMIYKGDRILWIFLAAVFFVFAISMATAQTVKDIIKVKISGNGYSDETFIRFKEGATASFESDKDAWKMFSLNPAVPMIFTKIDGYAVSVNTFPVLKKKNKVDLFTKIKMPGSYSLEARIISPFADTVKIYLLDKLTNEKYNVRTDSAVTMFLPADSGEAARFQLYFSTPVLHASQALTCFENKDGQITLENLSDLGWQIDIADENNVFQKSIAGNNETVAIPNLHGGNYFTIVRDLADTAALEIRVDQPDPVISQFGTNGETVSLEEGGKVQFFNNSIGANNFSWEFGDGAKSTSFQNEHTYTEAGEYIVSLAVSEGQCSDTSWAMIRVVENFPMGMAETGIKEEGTLYHNGNSYVFSAGQENLDEMQVEVFNLLGQNVPAAVSRNYPQSEIKIDITAERDQYYIFRFKTKNTSFSKLAF